MIKFYITLLSAAVAVSAAQPHHHAHEHFHKDKRAPSPVADVVVAPGPTEVVYVLNGAPIPDDEVQQGIKNGSLVYADDGQISSAAPVSVPTTTSTSTSTSTSTPPPPPTTTSTSVAPPPTTTPHTSSAAPAPVSVASTSGGTGVDTDFPSGQVDCSTFPSDYGAVSVEWTGLGGWTGIQCPASSSSGGFSDIVTKTAGSTCEEGDYCSYACPPGYQKSQWPSTQGSTGQSVGGLLCQNGKLQLTNPTLSKQLCMPGASEVNIQVQNTLGQNVAVCRTDYPGTESETVPNNVEPGTTNKLTCPDASNYYTWQGGSTSAQYYVNPAGVAVNDACTWGSSANPWGNYAPLNLGVGWSNGAAWLSIFQNSPTTNAKLDYTVTIEGDGLSGTCRYSNGQYCSGEGYTDCSTTTGCTVSLSSGSATFVFSS